MATNTLPRELHVYDSIPLPRIRLKVRRKDLWLGKIVFLVGLLIPTLMLFDIIAPNLFLGFVGVLLILFGGMYYFIRIGEIG